MEKIDLTKQFSHRLREAMINAGFNSHRSSSGVSIQQLAEITGYSLQICRKYLRGEAIPEPLKLVEIAQQLKVSAGWLLFGEASIESYNKRDQITISKNLLHYMFSKAASLYNAPNMENQVSDFLIELINDVSLIHATEEQSKKIIDLAIASVRHFSR
ncbi:helix-turn-helix domain-containing protein [Legionella sp. km772]|uniref:helix-turn-helix domain-containing protein n=1 Tax=Legionella sp. km772 TaxID=2498111 RepID=UPI000F8C9331|nr:helix-turn-helix transcriptional regulator [Legionella sp. km772]RUR12012.1 XRE family transcriptional regulator [Legionella sp. km772]